MAKKKTTKKTKTKEKNQKLAPREYTDEEKARLGKYEERAKKQPVKFKMVKSDSGNPTLKLKDPDDTLRLVKLSEAMGTTDGDLRAYLIEQVAGVFKGACSEDMEKLATIANNSLAMLNGIQPQDELEGMLAVQMIGTHNMAMDCVGRATRTERVDFMNTYMNGATKMLRTFAAQIEALTKYRTGGQQKMTVEHVHVNEGGQAIVGTVNQGGGGKNNENCG